MSYEVVYSTRVQKGEKKLRESNLRRSAKSIVKPCKICKALSCNESQETDIHSIRG